MQPPVFHGLNTTAPRNRSRWRNALLRATAMVLLCTTTSLAGPSSHGNLPNSGADAALAQIIEELRLLKWDAAFGRTQELLKLYPNFRLAHLIQGDLLIARSAPLQGFGNQAQADDKLADLRAEAQARLKAWAQPAPADKVPAYLLQLPPSQNWALVADTSKSRLYLYRHNQGRLSLAGNYYFTQGKEGANKRREGDKRTPVGVYHVTSHISPNKIGDFYGAGAFPINYPNEWDKRSGRNGHGIWLHGVPANTYTRPPKASDGCVVLSNEDLINLGKLIQPGQTPVIISTNIDWQTPSAVQDNAQDLRNAVEAWRRDWESLNTHRYLSHYASDFNSEEGNLSTWGEKKRRVNEGKSWLKLKLDDLALYRDPSNVDLAVVSFTQDYRSSNLSSVSSKRQYWVRQNKQWKILYEGNA